MFGCDRCPWRQGDAGGAGGRARVKIGGEGRRVCSTGQGREGAKFLFSQTALQAVTGPVTLSGLYEAIFLACPRGGDGRELPECRLL